MTTHNVIELPQMVERHTFNFRVRLSRIIIGHRQLSEMHESVLIKFKA